MYWRVIRTVLLLAVVSFTMTWSALAQNTSGQADWTAGISDAGRFGGPGSVGDTIADDREARDPAFRLPALDEARKDWFTWKDRVQKEHGLAISCSSLPTWFFLRNA